MRILPDLETERLLIRPFALDDLDAVHRLFDLEGQMDRTLEQRREWLEWCVLNIKYLAELDQPPYGDRAVVLKATGELIGSVGIVPYVDSFAQIAALHGDPSRGATAEVGLYWFIDLRRRCQGFATEAAAGVARYLFDSENLGRVIATTGDDNLASQAVMRKLGMVVERAASPRPPDIFAVGVLANAAPR